MARYIDGKTALKIIDNYAKTVTADGMVVVKAIRDIVEIITPTADVVEVVRCKDCKHRTATEYTETGFHCGLHSEGCGYVEMDPDDFCSYGEKTE